MKKMSAFLWTTALLLSACWKGGDLQVGDAVIQIQDGVYEIISCSRKDTPPVCKFTWTDAGFFMAWGL